MPWSHARIHEIFVLSQSFTHAWDSEYLIHFFVIFLRRELTVNIWAFWILIPWNIRPSDKLSSSQSKKWLFDSHYFVTGWISLELEWENSQTFNKVEVTMMHIIINTKSCYNFGLKWVFLNIFTYFVISADAILNQVNIPSLWALCVSSRSGVHSKHSDLRKLSSGLL